MGTSASSRGPGSGVPLVPDWVANPAGQPSAAPGAPPPQMAPPRRFQPARTSLGKFGKGGDKADLRKGVGRYSRTGMGGAASASERMAGTARTAGGLYNILDSLASGTALPPNVGISSADLAGKNQQEISDLIVDALRPVDGAQDSEVARDSASRAFSELLEFDPNPDLTALTPDQIDRVVEAYMANDIANRVELDVGKAVLDKSPSAAEGVIRLQEMKDYIRETVRSAFRAREQIGQTMTRQNATTLAADTLRDTFEIFESYL